MLLRLKTDARRAERGRIRVEVAVRASSDLEKGDDAGLPYSQFSAFAFTKPEGMNQERPDRFGGHAL
jgi:hypothetical protein